MQSSSDGEIIYFRTPNSEQYTIFVTNLHWEVTQQEMYNIFGRYGLINKIVLGYAINAPIYAIIKYYSSSAAHKALIQTNGITIRGLKLTVRTGKKEDRRGKYIARHELTHKETVQLANYYLGYNQWMSSIKEIKPACEIEQTEKNQFKSTYNCVVQLYFKQCKQTIEAEGKGSAVDKSRMRAAASAMKKATSDARKKAFSMCNIMLFSSGRAVPILPELPPPSPSNDSHLGKRKHELLESNDLGDKILSLMDFSNCEEKEGIPFQQVDYEISDENNFQSDLS